ncbi:hypothetical protein HDF24_23755 [Mucilaginibacter sp. X4EP1]|uniref:hypothetical protein n=1 Tax=Mucilaginibacter sp. X4EP1 TaxID=2723092 RepID=UPI00216A7569|nr:hypothetical protein [Mucilaginibacter sp. X4EP1]MCS3815950.1 hypothetical protein [Mucilaginibacter sp. X4EP1]
MENKDWINDYPALKKVNPYNPFKVPADYFESLAERIMLFKNLAELKQDGSTGGFIVPENYFHNLPDNIQSRITIEEALNTQETGFAVPDGYFDTLINNIQSRINIEEALNTEETGFAIPEGYFDTLANNIQSRINIEEALSTEETGFAVPEGYFDTLAGNIQSRINIEETLNAEETGFAVPEGYFDTLAGNIQSRIFVEEALNEQDEAFAVPDGYFDALHKNITDKTSGAKTEKAGKGIVRRMVISTAFKYATAACFAVAIGGGILINQLSGPDDAHEKTFLHKQLSNVPVDDIKAYLQLNVDAGDAQQTVNSENVKVDEKSLKDALQSDLDSVQ